MMPAGQDPPAGSAPAGRRQANPPIQRRMVSRLLSPGADEAVQKRLVYSIDGRQAVLVELNLSAGAIADDMREQFRAVFHAAFGQEADLPPEPLQISTHYMRCLLTQDEISRLAQQDVAAPGGSAPLAAPSTGSGPTSVCMPT